MKIGFPAEAELGQAGKDSPSAEVRIRARRTRQAMLAQFVQLTGHSSRTRCLTFSPDGALLATGSDDGTVHLWDVATRKSISEFTPAESASHP